MASLVLKKLGKQNVKFDETFFEGSPRKVRFHRRPLQIAITDAPARSCHSSWYIPWIVQARLDLAQTSLMTYGVNKMSYPTRFLVSCFALLYPSPRPGTDLVVRSAFIGDPPSVPRLPSASFCPCSVPLGVSMIVHSARQSCLLALVSVQGVGSTRPIFPPPISTSLWGYKPRHLLLHR